MENKQTDPSDTPLHYYCLVFTYMHASSITTIYVGLVEQKVTAQVVNQCKENLQKNNGDIAALTSVSYLGHMKPSEFDPDNCPGELLE